MQAIKNPTPIQRPATFGPWSIGQQCQIAELPGTWAIDSINIFDFRGPHEFEQINLNKLKKDGTRAKYTATVRAEKLLPLGAKQPNVDKHGRTAQQAAEQIFTSGFAKHGYCRTSRETLVKVISISKAGRVKAQRMNVTAGLTTCSKVVEGQKIYSQEEKLVNLASLEYELRGEPETYSASLSNSEWIFGRDNDYIEVPSMRLTWLND